ncbi:MAG: thioesterase family protein [Acidimicrobiales bacterium]|nr:thioesterase family protein [Acidimicrobiales bacterium]
MSASAAPVTFAQMMVLEAHGPDTFVGLGPQYPWGGLYGGQIVAQSLRAAGLTVEPQHLPHSLHAFFIRPGDQDEPIRFEVDRIRNGRSFSTRRVVARQSIGAIFNLACSFHVLEDAPDVHPRTMPAGVGSPDDHASATWSHVFDRRPVGSPLLDPDVRSRRAWMRMTEPVADDPLTQACALAYISDDLPTEAVVADHPDAIGLTSEEDFDRVFMSASLDHAIWFHRPLDAGTWHLHDLKCRTLTGSRGLASGDVFTAAGSHAATVSQEVLLRLRR